MDRNKRLIALLIFAVAILSGCVGAGYTPTQPGIGGVEVPLEVAQATYAAAANSATRQAAEVYYTAVAGTAQVNAAETAVAGTATSAALVPTQTAQAVQTSTAEYATAEISRSRIEAEKIVNLASAQGTAEAIGKLSELDDIMVQDEAARIAIARQADLVAIQKDQAWSILYRVLVFVVILLFAALLAAGIFTMRERSKPLIFDQGPSRPATILIPNGVGFFNSGQYRQLAPPKTAVDEPPIEGEIIETPETEMKPIIKNHFLCVGPTDAGKSTAMRYILQGRQQAGQRVIVLDPHHEPGSWMNAEVFGGGRNFDEIATFMEWMMDELNARSQMLSNGRKDWGGAITVATDEMPAIADELGKDTNKIWRRWLREGRKFDLYFALSTQSDRVKSLGIEGEGDVLKNFGAVLYLAESAVTKFGQLTAGQNRPAILSTMRGAQPVIVPNIGPNGHLLQPDRHQIAAPQINPSLLTVHNQGMNTEWGFISPAQIIQIETLTLRGDSGRSIERTVFGYDSGAAFQMRKAVVEQLGIE